MKKILLFLTVVMINASLTLAQTVQVSGTVKDAQEGTPMPGVFVSVRGTTLGTITLADGRYTLAVPAGTQTLVFSFVGYRTQEIQIAGRTVIDVALQQDVFNVEEVVVVAYGTQQKRDVAGAIASVKGEALAKMPVQSFDQALQGKASGVSITIPNGVLNNPPVIRIRGVNSISSSSYPLIVVDGVPVFTGDIGNSAAANTLADINPSDIASVEILKDASATAIYGSRAANGVIMITTKKGQQGQVKVTYDGSIGYMQPYHIFEVMNTEQYIALKNLAQENAGTPVANRFKTSLDANGKVIDTNWADYIYQTGFQQNHAITVSGATSRTSYFLSLGYSDVEGMVRQNYYTRTNARLNLEHKVNDYVTLGANISYINNYNFAPNTGSLPGQGFNTAGAGRLAFVTAPIVSPYNNDGTYNIASNNQIGRMGNVEQVGFYNPVPIFDKNKNSVENDRLLGTVFLAIEPIKGLQLKSVYGVDNILSERIVFQTPIHGDGFSNGGGAYNDFDRRNRWSWTNTVSYNKSLFDKVNVGLLLGSEEQYTTYDGWGGDRIGVTDVFFETYQGSWATPQQPTNGGQTENYFVSFFGRMTLNYDRKYFVEVSGRRDGFSGLAAGRKYGNFGGASVMWNISNESFVKNSSLASMISDLRLKASYGRVGNISGVGDFASLFLYGAGTYNGAATLAFNQAGNADLEWEASDKYDVGLAFGILKDRLQFDINYYYNNVNGLILDVPQAPSKGIPGNTIPQNIGSMYNTGFDISLTSYNISKPNFQWSTTLNFNTLKNEVTALAPGVDFLTGATSGLETANRTLVGYQIGTIWGVQTAGVDPTTGRRIFVKADGTKVTYDHSSAVADRWRKLSDGTVTTGISYSADSKALGNALPKFYGGIDNNLSYRGIDLSLGLTYAMGFYVYNGSKAGLRDQRFWNNSVEVYKKAWRQPGDITDIPKPVYGDNVSNGSTMPASQNVEKGDYMKVRNIALGYTIKHKYLNTVGIRSVRLSAQVFNAFVITKYTGSDPEISSNGNSNLAPGVDRNSVPQARTYTMGLNLVF